MPDPSSTGGRTGPRGPLKQRAAAFEGLGKALRWLREQRLMKQYQAAEAAGVTKAMLSAYETGKQRPTLDTLERLLDGLGVGLSDLADILPILRTPLSEGRPGSRAGLEEGDRRISSPILPSAFAPFSLDLKGELGDDLDPEEEEAIRRMVLSYLGWLRVIRSRTASPRSG